jgi:hypothetical protein
LRRREGPTLTWICEINLALAREDPIVCRLDHARRRVAPAFATENDSQHPFGNQAAGHLNE